MDPDRQGGLTRHRERATAAGQVLHDREGISADRSRELDLAGEDLR
jgi:hypothetical protein